MEFFKAYISGIRDSQILQIFENEINLNITIENALNECIADGLRRRQGMLNDFNKAQDLLKGKIAELAQKLSEAEERFKNRESVPEDLELIDQLQVL